MNERTQNPSPDQLRSPREIEGVSLQEFQKQISETYEPIVVRQLARDWNLVKAATQSADAAAGYLKKFDGGGLLPLVVCPAETEGRLFYDENYDGFNFTREKLTLSEGLNRMLSRTGGDPFSFFQCLPVAAAVPGLEGELTNPIVPEKTKPHVWIGSRITVAAHFDEAKNVAIVAAGRRRFTLFPPEQVNNLYIGRLDFTPAGQPISLADPKTPDFERHPRFREALDAAFSVELLAGDAIYIPAPWWHHVESLDNLNVLVNYWWDGALAASGLPFTALIHAIQAYRHLAQPERNAWKSLVEHYAFESDGDPAAHLAPNNPGILAPMNPDLARHIDRWLAALIGQSK